ncbi:MAG TPA: zinc ribbon domain-containing protein [Acidobacteriaceae bacterium]|jgi:hypothetical protein|nr:zinc ribbon domain-containing protein [Acidobacteriaceae bacterium]
MKFCSNCGKELEGSGRFCVNCGADTAAAMSTAAAPLPGPIASMPPPPPMAAGPAQYASTGAGPIPVMVSAAPAAPAQKRGGMTGTLVVLAAIVAGGYYYYNHPKTSAPTPAPAPIPTPSGNDKALVQQQSFNAQWQDESGMLILTSAKWTNSANVTLSTATVQCEQYNADGTDLSQYRVTLNGPTDPNAASTYSNVQMGAVATGMSKVNCDVVHVKE